MKYLKKYESKNELNNYVYNIKLLSHLKSFFKELGYTKRYYSDIDNFQGKKLISKTVEFDLKNTYIFSIQLKQTVAVNYYFRFTKTSNQASKIFENKVLNYFMDFIESIDGINVYMKRQYEFCFDINYEHNINEIISKINKENFNRFILMKNFNI